VVAVDAVDSGSVRLAHDSILPVRYDPRQPRRAVIAGGSRSYPLRNRPLYWLLAVGVPVGLTFLFLLARSRGASAPGSPTGPATPAAPTDRTG
jgi:hypothetical protein